MEVVTGVVLVLLVEAFANQEDVPDLVDVSYINTGNKITTKEAFYK